MQGRTILLMHSFNLPGILSPADSFIPELVKKRHGRQLGARKSSERVKWRDVVQRESYAIEKPKSGEPHRRRRGARPHILELPTLSFHCSLELAEALRIVNRYTFTQCAGRRTYTTENHQCKKCRKRLNSSHAQIPGEEEGSKALNYYLRL